MTNPPEPLTYWQSLASAADAGQLYLNAEAAGACSRACDTYISKLIGRKEQAKELANVDGWGEFESGRDLRAMFSRKAVGGEDNMVDVLESHIEVVRQMQAVFRKFFVDSEAVDQATAAGLGQAGPR